MGWTILWAPVQASMLDNCWSMPDDRGRCILRLWVSFMLAFIPWPKPREMISEFQWNRMLLMTLWRMSMTCIASNENVVLEGITRCHTLTNYGEVQELTWSRVGDLKATYWYTLSTIWSPADQPTQMDVKSSSPPVDAHQPVTNLPICLKNTHLKELLQSHLALVNSSAGWQTCNIRVQ